MKKSKGLSLRENADSTKRESAPPAHSIAGWVGWDIYWSKVAGQRLNMGGSSAYIDHADAIGSTVMETDPAGGVQWDTTYYPWGQVWQQGGTRQSAAFAGLDWRVNDPLIPSATRELSPALGPWLTPDPLGGDITNPQSLNRYAYVMNNPTTLTDPLGLQSGDFDPRACQDPAYADSHAECQGPGSDYCSQFPYSPECSGYPGGGIGGVGSGGNRPAPPGAPPAGQPPLAGMGNASFPQGGSFGLPPGCEQLPGGVIWCPPGSVPWQWLIPAGAATAGVLLLQQQAGAQVPQQPQQPNSLPPTMQQVRCDRAMETAKALGVAAAFNALGAVVTSDLPPLGAIYGGIALGEGLGSGAFAVYAVYVCTQW